MKKLVTFLWLILILSCNQHEPEESKKQVTPDSSLSNKDVLLPAANQKTDTALLINLSTEILQYIKAKDYEKFASFIHPADSIRFSPYAHIDTVKDLSFSSNQFILLSKQNKAINWNSGWEQPEKFTINKYFTKYVYDVDFLKAELKSINRFHSQGTDLNNIKEVYPDCDVVEFFFPGFDKKYDGMDFRGLRLVFKTEKNKPWLVGVVHDQWTP